MHRFVEIFADSGIGDVIRYEPGDEPDRPGTVKFAAIRLEGQEFAVMDSAAPHEFTFTPAFSFVINCDTQTEIDYLWERLSPDPSAEQCRAQGPVWRLLAGRAVRA